MCAIMRSPFLELNRRADGTRNRRNLLDNQLQSSMLLALLLIASLTKPPCLSRLRLEDHQVRRHSHWLRQSILSDRLLQWFQRTTFLRPAQTSVCCF